jgi:mono/diheme cytochrome c family protein
MKGRKSLAEAFRMTLRKIVSAILVIVIVCVVVGALLVWKPQIDPVETPKVSAFNSGLVAKGAELAAIGNCAVCHTTPGGTSYAGSRALPTPFGIIYSSNITPDSETGIGNWSEEAFRRALRDGLNRQGRHLYPAFPYDHFTHLTDDDIHALYAYIITREPAHSIPPANKLQSPYNVRSLLAGWKLLFLDRDTPNDDATKSAQWNRGRYLVESAAHCGACHTPRNFMGAEIKSRAFDGGVSEGWDAPSLNSSSPAPKAWTADQLFTYLRTGWQAQHGGAAGPMASVTENLVDVPENDIRAIAVYIVSLSNGQQDKPLPSQRAPANSTAAVIYAGACGVCHDKPAGSASQGLPLLLSSSLHEPRPRNTINIILRGIARQPGEPGPFMPAFDGMLSDSQIAELVAYVRDRFTNESPWSNIGDEIDQIRKGNPS